MTGTVCIPIFEFNGNVRYFTPTEHAPDDPAAVVDVRNVKQPLAPYYVHGAYLLVGRIRNWFCRKEHYNWPGGQKLPNTFNVVADPLANPLYRYILCRDCVRCLNHRVDQFARIDHL